MASLTRAERETIVRFDQASDLASIYTHDTVLIRQLEKRGFVSIRDEVCGGHVIAKSFEVSKDALSIRLKSKRTAKQRAASREAGKRLAKRNKAKKLLGDSAPEAPTTPSNPRPVGRTAI